VLEFRPMSRFTAYDKVILAGGLAMAAGTFFPIIRLPLVGTVNYLAGGHGDGTIVLPLAGAVIAAVFYGYRRTAAGVGFVALAIMMTTLLNMLGILSKLQSETAGLEKDNPFGGLVNILANSVGLEWGWLPLIGGALAVMGAGAISGEVAEKIGWGKRDKNELSRFPSHLDQDSDDRRARGIDQEIARHGQVSQQPILVDAVVL
jgi:hypothetical protein